MKDYKKEYKRLKAKEDFWAIARLAIIFVGLVVYGIMR